MEGGRGKKKIKVRCVRYGLWIGVVFYFCILFIYMNLKNDVFCLYKG